jgi:hypothetical protein
MEALPQEFLVRQDVVDGPCEAVCSLRAPLLANWLNVVACEPPVIAMDQTGSAIGRLRDPDGAIRIRWMLKPISGIHSAQALAIAQHDLTRARKSEHTLAMKLRERP